MGFSSNLVTSLSWTCTSKLELACHNGPLLFWAITGSCHITPATAQYTSLVLKGNPTPNGAEWDGGRGGWVTLNRKDAGRLGVVSQIRHSSMWRPCEIAGVCPGAAGCPPQTLAAQIEKAVLCTLLLYPQVFSHHWSSNIMASEFQDI